MMNSLIKEGVRGGIIGIACAIAIFIFTLFLSGYGGIVALIFPTYALLVGWPNLFELIFGGSQFMSYQSFTSTGLVVIGCIYFAIGFLIGSLRGLGKPQWVFILSSLVGIFFIVFVPRIVEGYINNGHCRIILDAENRLRCTSAFASHTRDPEVCRSLDNAPPYRRDTCFVRQTYSGNFLGFDLSFCEKNIESTGWRDICYQNLNYAKPLGESTPVDLVAVCKKISDPKTRDGCIESLLILRDATPCLSEITDTGARSSCFRRAARELENAEICSQVPLPVERDICFWEMAKILKNSNLCGRAEAFDVQNMCRAQF